jgi:hypothetical protein
VRPAIDSRPSHVFAVRDARKYGNYFYNFNATAPAKLSTAGLSPTYIAKIVDLYVYEKILTPIGVIYAIVSHWKAGDPPEG